MAGIGIKKPRHPNPIVAAYLARVALAKTMLTPTWDVACHGATNKRPLTGSGDLAKEHPKYPAAWEKRVGGKPLTKAEKRRRKAARNAMREAQAAFNR